MWGNEENKEQVQGSKEWHEFRKRHIGASEVPALMGTCDFKNKFQLWLDKTGIFSKEVNNFATNRGKMYEPIILEEFTKRTGLKTVDKVLEYPEFTTLSASLDGWIEESKIVVEVKCPSRAKHQMALCGEVPTTYRDQLQAQLLVAGANSAFYVSYAPDEPELTRLAIVHVHADKERQSQILDEAKKFWTLVESKTPPEGSSVQPELHKDLILIDQLKNQISVLEGQKEEMEKELKSKMKANKVICEEFTLSWSERKGTVDYSKIPELKLIDLEQYRKPSSKVFSFRKKE